MGEYAACTGSIFLGQTDTCEHRRPDAEHQTDACGEKKKRSHDVDGRNAVGSYATPYEYAVDNRKDGVGKHANECGEENFAEKRPYFIFTKIDGRFLDV